MISSLFAIIFKVLPDAVIKWKDVMVGAMVTAILFMLGKFAITFYIGNSSIGATYGAAASIVVLLVWVYYSALFFISEQNLQKPMRHVMVRGLYPNKYGVWVKNVEVEQEKKSLKQVEQIEEG